MTRKVAVLMGGWSPEREVSLVSGRACAEGLREGGHEVLEYDVCRDLRALIDFLRPSAGGGPDVVFNALHGRYGEDGCLQGVLEILAVPYTHSGVLASAIAMDKPMARHVFTSIGLRVAEGRVIERRSLASGDPMPRPYVVKPIDQGSSVGVHIVREGDNLGVVEVAEAAFGEKVLVEKFVPGRELTVAIMADKAVAVTELRPRTKFYDYEAKYTEGITEHLVKTLGQKKPDIGKVVAKAKREPHFVQFSLKPRVEGIIFDRGLPAEKLVRNGSAIPHANSAEKSAANSGTAEQPCTVAWEGAFLDFGSLSQVNRELTRSLVQSSSLRVTSFACCTLFSANSRTISGISTFGMSNFGAAAALKAFFGVSVLIMA